MSVTTYWSGHLTAKSIILKVCLQEEEEAEEEGAEEAAAAGDDECPRAIARGDAA